MIVAMIIVKIIFIFTKRQINAHKKLVIISNITMQLVS